LQDTDQNLEKGIKNKPETKEKKCICFPQSLSGDTVQKRAFDDVATSKALKEQSYRN
jgi:hypothetical protein